MRTSGSLPKYVKFHIDMRTLGSLPKYVKFHIDMRKSGILLKYVTFSNMKIVIICDHFKVLKKICFLL